jgi:hypothetical protein
MFDSTPYVPPIEDAPSSLTPFVVTPPTAVVDAPVSSMFDSRPSESYGDVAVTATPESASEDVAFESEIAFEAEDAVMFEAAFEEPVPEAVAPALEADAAEPVVDAAAEPVVEAATDVLVEVNVVLEPATDEPVEAAEPMLDGVDPIDVPAAVPSGDDRVLLQFAATVPQDLAELRRIAADNQW